MKNSINLVVKWLAVLFVSLSYNPLIASQPDYKTVRFELTFNADINAVEVHAGFYENLDYPRGFRAGAMKLTLNGSLSQFDVSENRITVVKYEQYDGTPVTLSILYDMPDNSFALNVYTNHGGFGNIEGRILDLDGHLLGQFSSALKRGWENWQYHEIEFSPTGVKEYGDNRIESFQLSPNFPNPFNSSTAIRYSVVSDGLASVRVMNQRGQIIRTLIHEEHQQGEYVINWDGNDDQEMPVSSGVYFYIYKNGIHEITRKMTLLK